MGKVYIVFYSNVTDEPLQDVVGLLDEHKAFRTKEAAEEYIERLRDRYVQNMAQKFKRDIPDSFRQHLKLVIHEFTIQE